jgi:small nuclear ribonucleoprotein (snRNP)-like protein
MNLVLGDVEETKRTLSGEEGQLEWNTEVKRRGMLFVRGDAIILVAPPSRVKKV